MNPIPTTLPALLAASILLAAVPAPAESQQERDARMAWFREARFGMFIHWGVYAVPAGEWQGKKYGGGVEWIQSQAKIPTNDYTPLKDRFNPVKYDADAWVRLAKDAGMRYIVITSKHHDGFCLWDSAQTDWDVASTPYGKDVLKPLAEACARHGIRLCFYHSIMDWHHPEYGTKAGWRGNAANPSPDMDKFTAYLKAQLKELVDAYHPGILWFDGEWEDAWTHERAIDLDDYVRSLQPGIIVNNRIDKGRKGMEGFNEGGGFRGDYFTPEQQIPATGLPGADWESCMTMNNTWGYSAHDQNWKPAQALVRNLIDIASKGGNYLLNVGPTADGEIPGPSVERLQAIAAWMKANGESIHGTQANPFPRTPWGRCTVKPIEGGKTRLYLHVFDWPKDGKLELRGLANPVAGARLLADPAAPVVASNPDQGSVVLQLPAAAPDPVASVVALDITGAPDIREVPFRPGADGTIYLDAENATLNGRTLKIEHQYPEVNVGYWSDPKEHISFPVAFAQAGPHAAVLRWACAPQAADSRAEIRLEDKSGTVVSTLPITLRSTNDWGTFSTQPIGVLAVPAAEAYTLRIVPLEIKDMGLMNFASLRLQPAR